VRLVPSANAVVLGVNVAVYRASPLVTRISSSRPLKNPAGVPDVRPNNVSPDPLYKLDDPE
jgi:hypothetical protein